MENLPENKIDQEIKLLDLLQSKMDGYHQYTNRMIEITGILSANFEKEDVKVPLDIEHRNEFEELISKSKTLAKEIDEIKAKLKVLRSSK